MLRTLTVAVFVLAIGAGAAPARELGGTPVAFIAVEGSSQLVAVDLTTKRVVDRIEMPSQPRNVTTTGDLRYVLATSPQGGTVTLVDSFTGRIVHVFRGFGRPLDVAVEGSRGYVTDERRNQLVVLDLVRRRIAARIGVPRRPQSVAAGDVALITHAPPNGYLTVVQTDARGPLHPRIRRLAVPAEGGANDVTEQPDSAYAYVTGRRSGGVAGIDWGRGRARWSRSVGSLVRTVSFDYTHGRRIWTSDAVRGEVLALSSETGRVLRRLRGCPGAGPIAIGGAAWIATACGNANALAVWNMRTWKRTLVRVGARPTGVAVAVLP